MHEQNMEKIMSEAAQKNIFPQDPLSLGNTREYFLQRSKYNVIIQLIRKVTSVKIIFYQPNNIF